jgi:hypothetical protein
MGMPRRRNMPSNEELVAAYADATDSSRYLAGKTNHNPDPDFEGFFRRSLEAIDNLFMEDCQ